MWDYSDKVMEHYEHPRNVGSIENADAVGEVGSIVCGDALKLTLKIDDGRIKDARFKTFGCGSAIAAASALTEMIKGKTLEEAARITNQDIADYLGGLPTEKMHCSVMGQEALEAAIADFKGIKLEAHEEDEGEVVCKCFGVTDTKIKRVALANNLHTVEEVTNYTKAGGGCGACIPRIEDLLEEIWRGETEKRTAGARLTTVQKIKKIEEVLNEEVRPILKRDGGDVQLVDLADNRVVVRLMGMCHGCMAADLTLKGLVQDKLRELIDPTLEVVEDESA
jgi:NifU-like protein